MRTFVIGAVLLGMTLAAPTASQAHNQAEAQVREAMLGVVSVPINLVYTPVKTVMAVGGLLWSSSLIRSVIEAAERIGMEGAILLLSALSLVTISAAGAMMRLMQPAPLRLRSSA